VLATYPYAKPVRGRPGDRQWDPSSVKTNVVGYAMHGYAEVTVSYAL